MNFYFHIAQSPNLCYYLLIKILFMNRLYLGQTERNHDYEQTVFKQPGA